MSRRTDRFFSANSRRQRDNAHYRRLSLEWLEDRSMLAITVDTLVDELDGSIVDGDISLRDAIAAAMPGETIDFSVNGTITLTIDRLAIDKDLTIAGPGAELLTIDASGTDPTPNSTLTDGDDTNDGDGTRIFEIIGDGSNLLNVQISGVTITGGDAIANVQMVGGQLRVIVAGGAIFTSENLALVDSIVTGNQVVGSMAPYCSGACTGSGGGIFSGPDAFYSTPPQSLTILRSTVRENSDEMTSGGIVFQGGAITITDSAISSNTTRQGVGGVLTFNSGPLTITNSTITGNTSVTISGGLVVYDSGGLGHTIIQDSTISGNQVLTSGAYNFGGGVTFLGSRFSSPPANLTISRSIISDNSSPSAGGMWLRTYGETIIRDSVISGNSSQARGGGIYLDTNFGSDTTIESSSITGNSATDGGGIFAVATDALSVNGSTISGNSAADRGGGIYLGGPSLSESEIIHSTISGNRAGGDGGGVMFASFTHPMSSWRHNTITNNVADVDNNGTGTGGGIGRASFEPILHHSIVAGNRRGDLTVDDADFALGTYNVFGPIPPGGISPGVDGNQSVPDLLLGPLADNGGPTLPDGSPMLTHMLLPASPAVDAGDPMAMAGVGDVPEFDQRGDPFVRVVGARIDIGAYEAQGTPPMLAGDYNQDGVVGAADYVVWRNLLGENSALPNETVTPGMVTQDDYDVWKVNFGMRSTLTGNGNAVEANFSLEAFGGRDDGNNVGTGVDSAAVAMPLISKSVAAAEQLLSTAIVATDSAFERLVVRPMLRLFPNNVIAASQTVPETQPMVDDVWQLMPLPDETFKAGDEKDKFLMVDEVFVSLDEVWNHHAIGASYEKTDSCPLW